MAIAKPESKIDYIHQVTLPPPPLPCVEIHHSTFLSLLPYRIVERLEVPRYPVYSVGSVQGRIAFYSCGIAYTMLLSVKGKNNPCFEFRREGVLRRYNGILRVAFLLNGGFQTINSPRKRENCAVVCLWNARD